MFNEDYSNVDGGIFSNEIKKVFVNGPSLDAVQFRRNLEIANIEYNINFGENLGEDFVVVKNNDVYIQVGRNVVNSQGNEAYGVLEFDKLLVTERIEGGQIFVEVQGFRNFGTTSSNIFERWNRDTPEIPPED